MVFTASSIQTMDKTWLILAIQHPTSQPPTASDVLPPQGTLTARISASSKICSTCSSVMSWKILRKPGSMFEGFDGGSRQRRCGWRSLKRKMGWVIFSEKKNGSQDRSREIVFFWKQWDKPWISDGQVQKSPLFSDRYSSCGLKNGGSQHGTEGLPKKTVAWRV